tara:strand:- start:340 stop:822 length:483 start_codon:yes stop_codon:yes gene_type:complete
MVKRLNIDELESWATTQREASKSIVLANGAFDMLHVGHLRYLQGARAQGDVLIVAVNSDSSVKKAKGPSRPIIPEDERQELLEGLSCVDYTVRFSESKVDRVLRAVLPDVHAKGSDYTVETVPEAALVRELGGRVVIVGDPKDHSTTELVERLGRDKPEE